MVLLKIEEKVIYFQIIIKLSSQPVYSIPKTHQFYIIHTIIMSFGSKNKEQQNYFFFIQLNNAVDVVGVINCGQLILTFIFPKRISTLHTQFFICTEIQKKLSVCMLKKEPNEFLSTPECNGTATFMRLTPVFSGKIYFLHSFRIWI